MTAEQRFQADVKKAQGAPAAFNVIDVAHNRVEIVTHWQGVFNECRERHRRFPDVPEEVQKILTDLAIELRRDRRKKSRRAT
jgi:hypothetical protein